jgi:hypothetical protein
VLDGDGHGLAGAGLVVDHQDMGGFRHGVSFWHIFAAADPTGGEITGHRAEGASQAPSAPGRRMAELSSIGWPLSRGFHAL